MNNLQFYQQLQQQISDKFRDNASDKDEHKIEIYPSLSQDTFYIRYIPNHEQSNADNDGYVNAIQPLLFYGSLNRNRRTSMYNNQFTQIQHFDSHNDFLLINGIKVLNEKLGSFKQKLAQYGASISKNGTLVVKANSNENENSLKVFINILKATQFVINQGNNYTIQSNARAIELKDLTEAQQIVKDSINDYKELKNSHRTHHSIKSNSISKAHGKVVPGFSSTAGTPREKRYARERKQRAEAQAKAKAKANVKEVKIKPDKKLHKSNKLDLHGKDVTTIGDFPMPRALVIDKIHSLGGSYKTNLSHKTALVVCDHPSSTKKYLDAKAKGIPFINEKDL